MKLTFTKNEKINIIANLSARIIKIALREII